MRTFVYDSLNRLTSATNPESGATTPTSYQYDNNGNLTSKTDARNRTTTITYDALNRAKTKTYSCNTPAVSYVYDNQSLPMGAPTGFIRGFAVGRLVAVNYGSNSSAGSYYGYDELGRVVRKTQQINGNNYAVQNVVYNRASAMTSEIYPSGRTVNYAYDIAGRLSSFTGNLGDGVSRNYATGIIYTSAGLMTQEKFQAGTANQLYHNLHYNNRQQLYDARLGTGTGDGQTVEWTWNRGALRMYYASNYAYGDGGLNNNGNVYRMDHFIPLNDSVSQWAITEDYYGYDDLNRVTSFTDLSGGATSASQNFSYDRYGNRCVWNAIGGVSAYCPNYTASNNRISNLTYDAAGNITNDPATGGTMIYDGENRLEMATSGGGGAYTYDGEGKRVKRMLAGGQEWWYVYGIGGELLAEYLSTAPTTVKKEYGYRGGQLLVVWNGDESTADKKLKWLVTDHLGSTRMEADKSGSLGGMTRRDYAPFGEELFAGIRKDAQGQPQYGYTASNVRQKFTGYERDSETGLDYAQVRYYANAQGRFTGVDPLMASAKPERPQSWNRYSYCINNPLIYVDPSGMIWGFLQTNVGDRYVWYKDEEELKAAGATVVTTNDRWGIAFTYQAAGGAWIRLDLSQNSWRPFETEGEAYFGRTYSEGGSSNLGDLGLTLNTFGAVQGGFGLTRFGATALGRLFTGAGSETTTLGLATTELRFTQTTASAEFSAKGLFAGKTIGQVSSDLRSGILNPSQVPVQYIGGEGVNLLVNTRSALSLMRAGIPRNQWNLVNVSGNAGVQANIADRLLRNGLTSQGTDVLRITGAGKAASNLR
jgi:RHS repeat-associated protein